ncbi:MAG: alpha/beta fold hydrolase, partial [Vicinamibacterales bacterium]
VAFAVWRRAPGLVRARVLADTRATADSSEARAGRRALLAQVDREGAGGLARDMLPKLIGRTTMDGPTQVESTIRRIIKQQSAEAIRGGLRRMMERPDSTPDAAALTVPTLVVVGDEDAITPPAEAEALAALIPAAELAVIAGAGHLSSLEQPVAFGERLAAFLSRL